MHEAGPEPGQKASPILLQCRQTTQVKLQGLHSALILHNPGLARTLHHRSTWMALGPALARRAGPAVGINHSAQARFAFHSQDIPRLEMPLHTLIELVPKPDGKMAETRIKVRLLTNINEQSTPITAI